MFILLTECLIPRYVELTAKCVDVLRDIKCEPFIIYRSSSTG